LGLGYSRAPIGSFTGTGMHGGKIFIRTEVELPPLPAQVTKEKATAEEIEEIKPYIEKFCKYFNLEAEQFFKDNYMVLKPNAKNPYKQLYVAN